jgi:hypothetical protein
MFQSKHIPNETGHINETARLITELTDARTSDGWAHTTSNSLRVFHLQCQQGAIGIKCSAALAVSIVAFHVEVYGT